MIERRPFLDFLTHVVLILGVRRRHVAAGFALAALVAVLANAVITGGLSGPHDRYGARLAWLATSRRS